MRNERADRVAADQRAEDPTAMTDPQTIASKLTHDQRRSLRHYKPGVWYGTARPSRLAASTKGRMVAMGLVEHDGEAPVTHYRLTPLGELVRTHLEKESKK